MAAACARAGGAAHEGGDLDRGDGNGVAPRRHLVDDPLAAAHQFFESAKAGLIPALYFGLRDEVPPQDIAANVRRAVGLFMAYYGVRRDSTSPAA